MFRFLKRGAFGLFASMPRNLKRYYGCGHLHFITFSCHGRFALLGTVRARNVFVQALNEVRAKYGFALVGYVVMPEHVHLLIGEPKSGDPSTVIHSLKLRVSKRMRRRARETSAGQHCFRFADAPGIPRFWQPRFYDFNVWSTKKRREKLEYMHRNLVTRGLVKDPKDWAWSSYASFSERGMPLLAVDFVH
jgi:putative transposase